MGMSMLKIEIWLCKRIKIWNLYLTRKHHLLLLKTGFPTYSPFETIPCHWGHGLKETTPPTTKMEPEKKTTWNRRETSTETTTFFGFHVSSRGVGRCISEPKWSLIYLHSFSQKGGAGEFCWVKKMSNEKNPGCFTQTSRWLHYNDPKRPALLSKTRERQVQITWIFHIISMSCTSGGRMGREILGSNSQASDLLV